MSSNPYAAPAAAPSSLVDPVAKNVAVATIAVAVIFELAMAWAMAMLPLLAGSDRGAVAASYQWGGLAGLGAGALIAALGARRCVLAGTALASASLLLMAFFDGFAAVAIATVIFARILARTSLTLVAANALPRAKTLLLLVGLALALTAASLLSTPLMNAASEFELSTHAKIPAVIALAATVVAVFLARARHPDAGPQPLEPLLRRSWPAYARTVGVIAVVAVLLSTMLGLARDALTPMVRAALPPPDTAGAIGGFIMQSTMPGRALEVAREAGALVMLLACVTWLVARRGLVRVRYGLAAGLALAAVGALGATPFIAGSMAWPLMMAGLLAAGNALAHPFIQYRLYAGRSSRVAGVAALALTMAHFLVYSMTQFQRMSASASGPRAALIATAGVAVATAIALVLQSRKSTT